MTKNKFLLIAGFVCLIIAGCVNFALLYANDFSVYERYSRVKKPKSEKSLPRAIGIMKEARKAAIELYKSDNPMGISTKKEVQKQEVKKTEKVYKYSLTGIWLGEKTVIINGEILKEGDLLSDQISRVEKVLKNAVRIDRVGRKIILRLEE